MRTLALGLVAIAVGLGCGKKDKDADKGKSDEAPAMAAKTDDTTKAKAPITKEEATPVAAAADQADTKPEAACAMLTTEDAAKVLGMPVKDGKVENMGCSWDAEKGGINSVLFEMRPAAQFPVAQKIARDMAEKGGPKGSYEDLTGIGEQAFYGNLAGHQIVFLVGDRYGQVGLLGPKDDESKKRIIELAKQIAGEMK